jgi:hypothetical protein
MVMEPKLREARRLVWLSVALTLMATVVFGLAATGSFD